MTLVLFFDTQELLVVFTEQFESVFVRRTYVSRLLFLFH